MGLVGQGRNISMKYNIILCKLITISLFKCITVWYKGKQKKKIKKSAIKGLEISNFL